MPQFVHGLHEAGTTGGEQVRGIALDMTGGTQVRPPAASGAASPAPAATYGSAPAIDLTGMDDAAANTAFDSMPSGTVYIGPDGNQYRKP